MNRGIDFEVLNRISIMKLFALALILIFLACSKDDTEDIEYSLKLNGEVYTSNTLDLSKEATYIITINDIENYEKEDIHIIDNSNENVVINKVYDMNTSTFSLSFQTDASVSQDFSFTIKYLDLASFEVSGSLFSEQILSLRNDDEENTLVGDEVVFDYYLGHNFKVFNNNSVFADFSIDDLSISNATNNDLIILIKPFEDFFNISIKSYSIIKDPEVSFDVLYEGEVLKSFKNAKVVSNFNNKVVVKKNNGRTDVYYFFDDHLMRREIRSTTIAFREDYYSLWIASTSDYEYDENGYLKYQTNPGTNGGTSSYLWIDTPKGIKIESYRNQCISEGFKYNDEGLLIKKTFIDITCGGDFSDTEEYSDFVDEKPRKLTVNGVGMSYYLTGIFDLDYDSRGYLISKKNVDPTETLNNVESEFNHNVNDFRVEYGIWEKDYGLEVKRVIRRGSTAFTIDSYESDTQNRVISKIFDDGKEYRYEYIE
ncbi:hypothetical protein [Aquimarina spongiae]|uniref:Uncharacterized protein n=1 Tax=Aquimarina spongiae TaxID=570521 RepID=A0A1M6F9W6_9FLAO|nr:hypothetical protein [Aquimarina spongiae]SHI94461.1 hypothetical protein SAMN04488508_104165 [Aquimarina spongiae]